MIKIKLNDKDKIKMHLNVFYSISNSSSLYILISPLKTQYKGSIDKCISRKILKYFFTKLQ